MVLVRPATADDLGAVEALVRLTAPESSPMPPDAYPERFLEKTAPEQLLVAETDHRVVGFCKVGPASQLSTNSHVLTVAGLGVDPGHRGRGAGRALVTAAVARARATGARRLTLRVLSTNAPARRLYESLGFRVEGVLVAEFLLAGRYVDDVLMVLDLTAPPAP